MNNAEIFRILILAHAALGGVSLLAGFVAGVTQKGSKPHIISGRVFYYILGSSILLSLMAANMPDHYNPFLFSIGVFSSYFIIIGKRAIQYKSPGHSFSVDKLIHIIMMVTCILMVTVPHVVSGSFHIVAGVFGLMGLIFAIRNLYQLRNLDFVKKQWLKMHIGNMSGGFIASVTAFIVVNNFLPGVFSWFVPGIIGGIFIFYALRKIDKKSNPDLTQIKYSSIAVLVIFLSLTTEIIGQKSSIATNEKITIKVLSKQQMLDDLEILFSSIINYHPTPFLYTSEQEYQTFYDKQRSELPDSLTEMEFNIVAKQLIAQLKCGHTLGNLSDDWFASVKGKNVYLPFDIKKIEGKVYFSNTIDTTFDFNVNDEIININDKPINDILHQMAAIQERDGNTLSFVNEMSIRKFRSYFLYLYGIQDSFSLDFRANDGTFKKVCIKPTNKKMKTLTKLAVPDNFSKIFENNWSSLSVDTLHNIAYLDINSFGDRKEFKKYYQSIFKYLKQSPDMQLIIDLRNNGGGYFGHGNHFLTYLTPENFRFNFQKPSSIKEKNEYMKLGKWEKLTEFAFSIKPKKYKLEGQKTRTFTYKPQKDLFPGKVHVINNGITFSVASLVAAQLHENCAMMYGEETGGGEMSTNGMMNYKLELPNSKLKINIAHYQIVSNSTKGAFGSGVKPDYPYSQSIGNEKDEVLFYTLEKIKWNTAKNKP
ncbi:MAG: S41 family peptidase [Saprospiraceae bacterium]